MTRKQAIEKFAQNKLKNGGFVIDAYKQYIINAIYDDFEEELKKAYIEGGNDVWKALNCKELAK